MSLPNKTKGDFRAVYESMPDHPKFQALHPPARLLLYILKTTLGAAGIRQTYDGVLAERTGLPPAVIEQAAQELEAAGWIRREWRIWWLVDGLEHEPQIHLKNANHRTYVLAQVKSLPRLQIVLDFLAHYGLDDPDPDAPLQAPGGLPEASSPGYSMDYGDAPPDAPGNALGKALGNALPKGLPNALGKALPNALPNALPDENVENRQEGNNDADPREIEEGPTEGPTEGHGVGPTQGHTRSHPVPYPTPSPTPTPTPPQAAALLFARECEDSPDSPDELSPTLETLIDWLGEDLGDGVRDLAGDTPRSWVRSFWATWGPGKSNLQTGTLRRDLDDGEWRSCIASAVGALVQEQREFTVPLFTSMVEKRREGIIKTKRRGGTGFVGDTTARRAYT
jgi:hypothetical protein